MFNILERKCLSYINETLRAPSIPMVNRWGKNLGLSVDVIKRVNDQILLRHQLGTNFTKSTCFVEINSIIFKVEILVCYQILNFGKKPPHHYLHLHMLCKATLDILL
jgi:hypothetical protein